MRQRLRRGTGPQRCGAVYDRCGKADLGRTIAVRNARKAPGGLFFYRSNAMLVVSRKVGERVWIGDQISVTIVRVAQGVVRIGIEAPSDMPIVREELRQNSPVRATAPADPSNSSDQLSTDDISRKPR